MFPVTSVAAAILTFIYIFLAILVIRQRWKHRVALLDGGVTDLSRVIRAHANFAEYTPLMLILLGLCEASANANLLALKIIAYGFILGRLCHAYSLTKHEVTYNGYPYIRSTGMILTFLPLSAASVMLLISLA